VSGGGRRLEKTAAGDWTAVLGWGTAAGRALPPGDHHWEILSWPVRPAPSHAPAAPAEAGAEEGDGAAFAVGVVGGERGPGPLFLGSEPLPSRGRGAGGAGYAYQVRWRERRERETIRKREREGRRDGGDGGSEWEREREREGWGRGRERELERERERERESEGRLGFQTRQARHAACIARFACGDA
jgi:hypothetical protein